MFKGKSATVGMAHKGVCFLFFFKSVCHNRFLVIEWASVCVCVCVFVCVPSAQAGI